MSKDKRVFNVKEVDSNKTGWVADLSGDGPVNPDCYWHFNTKREAERFLALVDSGNRPAEALNIMDEGK